MQKEFKLETILSLINNKSFVDDFNEVFELVWFIYNDKNINTCGICVLREEMKEHLLSIHPELNEIDDIPVFKFSLEGWIKCQKLKYGESLPVCRIGEKLKPIEKQKTKRK